MKTEVSKKARLDWEQVRNRLRASEHALEAGLAENRERTEAVYRRRAALLAIQAEPEPQVAPLSTLVFSVKDERYAIGLSELEEVLPLRHCTRVPGAAKEFLGVINVRGALRPVVDLGCLLLRAETADVLSGFVLMLRRAGREIGLRVDGVEGLREIQSENLNREEERNFSQPLAGGSLSLLDVEKVLAEIFSAESR